MNKKVIAVMYEYFYPGYKAGGPIQSLVNMVLTLQNSYEFRIVTTAFDLNETIPYANVKLDSWNEVSLAPNTPSVKIWYASTKVSLLQMHTILQTALPDIIFINGLYTKWFTFPLLLKKAAKLGKVKIIISPRGMLQEGALNVKPTKKKIFLSMLKAFGLFKNVAWHATTVDEQKDIHQKISRRAKVIVAANVPKRPLSIISFPDKKPNELKLIYLSIITEKKKPSAGYPCIASNKTSYCI